MSVTRRTLLSLPLAAYAKPSDILDKRFSKEEICRLFYVSPSDVGELQYSAYTEAYAEFVRTTLNPWLKRYEATRSS